MTDKQDRSITRALVEDANRQQEQHPSQPRPPQPEPSTPLDVVHLATALRFVEQANTDRLGVVGPAASGPPPEWYRGYAVAVSREYERLTEAIDRAALGGATTPDLDAETPFLKAARQAAEGKIDGRPVSGLFDEDDPIVADVQRLAIFPVTASQDSAK